MPLAVKRLAGTSSRTVIDPATVMASGDIDPEAIGDTLSRPRREPSQAPEPL